MASTFSPPKNHSPLHNFPLSNLKWSMNQPTSQRLRRPLDPPTHHLTAENSRIIKLPYYPPISEKKAKQKKEEKAVKAKAKADAEDDDDGDADVAWGDDDDEPVAKTWNLRPRRPVKKTQNGNGNGNGGPLVLTEKKTAPSVGNNGNVGEGKNDVVVGKKKRRLSVNLAKEEIEEDFLILTGAKPPRRPKKRVKAVQKLLDGIFPGLWLTSVTTDMYKVPEPPLKG